MSLVTAITHNRSNLKFRIAVPEITGKAALYPYQMALTNYATKYIRQNHPGSKNPGKTIIRFQEIYEGQKYLQLTIPIFNKRGEEKIIIVEY